MRTDASVKIGSGHLVRCLTLADQLAGKGADVAFVCRDLPGGMFDLLQARGYRGAKFSLAEEGAGFQQADAEETIRAARSLFPDGLEWLVVDQYQLDVAWEKLLRPHVRNLMVIDDLANRRHDCDLLLDQNYYRNLDRRYKGLVPEQCVTLLGPAHVLLRPEFYEARQRQSDRDGKVKRILVFFGGSDPANQTQRVVEALKQLDRPDIAVDVVVGQANPFRQSIQSLCDELPNVRFHCQISNMAELIQNADLGIGAGGAAMWERCCLGLPTITVVFAANQVRTTEDVAEIGAIEYLGCSDLFVPADYARAIARMLDNPQRTKQIGDAALRVVQISGAPVAEVMCRFVPRDTSSHFPDFADTGPAHIQAESSWIND